MLESLSSQSAKQTSERRGEAGREPLSHLCFISNILCECSERLSVEHLLPLSKIKEPKLPMTTASCCAVACNEGRAQSMQILTALMNSYTFYPEGQSDALQERLWSALDVGN